MADLPTYYPAGQRPWFRFCLTLVISGISVLAIYLLFENHGEISNMVAVLIGGIVTKLGDALAQAFKWWFDNLNADESQNGGPNGSGHAAKPSEPTPAPAPQKARPDDY